MLTPEMLPNEYIGMYAKENTRYQKQFAIRRFLKTLLDHEVTDLNEAMTEYLASRDAKQVTADLMRYQTNPSYQTLAPKTKSLYASLIITYFEDCCNLSLSALQQTNTHLMARLTSLQAAVEDMQREQERITIAQISGLPHRLPHDDLDISDV